ncbi:MAG: hypothetical protein EXX96DRAFT_632426 [Benjaminiella poitrasii]|nr:MAG: hypothetical protein EXX96DRAFT_632426 [Benjaminiella poitrasii]
MANPKNYFKGFFFRLGELYESEELKPFSCLQLQRPFIPAYIAIYTLIVNHHILKHKKRFTDKLETWGQVVNLNRKAFKNQGIQIQGTIETDGVGVSIINQNSATNRKRILTEEDTSIKSKSKSVNKDIVEHIEELTKEGLKQTTGRCVFIDPGRRDLMYSAESILSGTHPSSVNLDKFAQYIEARASVDGLLNQYYGNDTNHFPQNSTLPDETANCQLYTVYIKLIIQQNHVTKRLDTRVTEEVFELTEEMLTGGNNDQKARVNTLLENLQILPFRKMKFSSKIYYDQNDEELVRSLKKKFGSDAVLIFGDWLAPNTKFHEPTRNKGFIRILKNNGFTVYLINEREVMPVVQQQQYKKTENNDTHLTRL